eukprot:837017-Rhodomonas_salina.1
MGFGEPSADFTYQFGLRPPLPPLFSFFVPAFSSCLTHIDSCMASDTQGTYGSYACVDSDMDVNPQGTYARTS